MVPARRSRAPPTPASASPRPVASDPPAPRPTARSRTTPINVGSVDFGDAPDSYGTPLASNGPNHRIVAGFSLGATEDGESEGQPNVGATGDGADEDGVVLPNSAMLTACTTANVSVLLTNTAGIATPRLDAWIDFDGDGAFGDPRDRIATGLALVAGANNVTVNVPCDAQSAATYARFRLSSAGVSGPGGASPDGEIEDYALRPGPRLRRRPRSHLPHPPGVQRRPPRGPAGR